MWTQEGRAAVSTGPRGEHPGTGVRPGGEPQTLGIYRHIEHLKSYQLHLPFLLRPPEEEEDSSEEEDADDDDGDGVEEDKEDDDDDDKGEIIKNKAEDGEDK